jgi:acyl-CoA synthetase (AMP-forming)/AMP-acid ligase II
VAILIEFESDTAEDLTPIIDRIASELAPYKIPELGAKIDQLPRNAMGKVDRKKLVALGTPLVERLPRQTTA